MEIEKEVRYIVDNKVWQSVIDGTTEYKPQEHMIDITMGKYGFESFAKTGLVFRVRQKGQKTTLEIKKRVQDREWQEESIVIDSVKRGVSYLSLAGLSPYLYIDRTREVRRYKGLKIFLDDVKMLGKYIEIEYQESDQAENELREFLQKFDITSDPQPLYGDIIIAKYRNDQSFKNEFDKKLQNLIS